MQIKLLQGDITQLQVDAIVNAANNSLLGGGGVDGAIHRVGGKAILEECKQIRNQQGGCATGEAVATTGGNLPVKKVIHTVGPVWQGGQAGETELLRNCYCNSLKLAEAWGMKSIAFPNISTGIYRFPKWKAAQTAVEAVKNYESDKVEEVIFVCFDEENYLIYKELL
ncbi:MAG: O-acetyl-ADP-ribose deacetylase [Bacteroidota bacterium]